MSSFSLILCKPLHPEHPLSELLGKRVWWFLHELLPPPVWFECCFFMLRLMDLSRYIWRDCKLFTSTLCHLFYRPLAFASIIFFFFFQTKRPSWLGCSFKYHSYSAVKIVSSSNISFIIEKGSQISKWFIRWGNGVLCSYPMICFVDHCWVLWYFHHCVGFLTWNSATEKWWLAEAIVCLAELEHSLHSFTLIYIEFYV